MCACEANLHAGPGVQLAINIHYLAPVLMAMAMATKNVTSQATLICKPLPSLAFSRHSSDVVR